MLFLNIKSLKVINSIGQNVVSESKNINSIDVSTLESGIYKIIILDENYKMYVRKNVIKFDGMDSYL